LALVSQDAVVLVYRAMKKPTKALHYELNSAFFDLQEAHLALPLLHREPREHDREQLRELAERVRRYYRKLEEVHRRWEAHSEG
jgi:hypothetical protein